MLVSAAPVFRMTHAASAHVAVHVGKPALKSKMTAARMEAGDHAAAAESAATESAATARIRIAPRE